MSFEAQAGALLIDATEQRESCAYDILGSCLHADIPEDKQLLLKPHRKFVDTTCQVNSDHKQFIAYENRKKVLCSQI